MKVGIINKGSINFNEGVCHVKSGTGDGKNHMSNM